MNLSELAFSCREHPASVLTLAEFVRLHKPEFKPVPHYNHGMNFIEWYWEDVRCYEESVHHDGKWVGCVMRSFETLEVVGVKVFLEAAHVVVRDVVKAPSDSADGPDNA